MSYDSQDLNDDSSSEEEYMMFEKHKAKNKDASNSEDKVRVATPAMYFNCIYVYRLYSKQNFSHFTISLGIRQKIG